MWSTPKIDDRDTVFIMVGYNHNSGSDVYRVWHIVTNRVHHTRHIIWWKKKYHETMTQFAEIINREPNVINIEGY